MSLSLEERKELEDAGWIFSSDDLIYLFNDSDGCMAHGERQIRRILDSIRNRKDVPVEGCWIRKSGVKTEVLLQVHGKWKLVFSEEVSSPLSHIVEPSGIKKSIVWEP